MYFPCAWTSSWQPCPQSLFPCICLLSGSGIVSMRPSFSLGPSSAIRLFPGAAYQEHCQLIGFWLSPGLPVNVLLTLTFPDSPPWCCLMHGMLNVLHLWNSASFDEIFLSSYSWFTSKCLSNCKDCHLILSSFATCFFRAKTYRVLFPALCTKRLALAVYWCLYVASQNVTA